MVFCDWHVCLQSHSSAISWFAFAIAVAPRQRITTKYQPKHITFFLVTLFIPHQAIS